MHGLKDILVRENDSRARETADLRVHVDAGLAQVEEVVEREVRENVITLYDTTGYISSSIHPIFLYHFTQKSILKLGM